jgi:hypothetical protein
MNIAIMQHAFTEASIEGLNSKWALQVGRRAEELMEMLKTGEYP